MKFFNTLIFTLLLLLLSGSTAVPAEKNSKMYISDYENVLGTSFEIKIVSASANQAKVAENAALDEVYRLNEILSGYDASSEFSRWLHGDKKATKVSPELYEVLSLFDKWRNETNGALDASAEVVESLWRKAAKQNRVPTQAEITRAVALVKEPHWRLNKEEQTALRLDDAPLMLNSFTKSYVMDKACDAALAIDGISAVVVNIGGDIVVRGKHTELIQVSNPKADAENDAPLSTIKVGNKTIATSGNYRRGELINGKWYSHIVDPRNGKPVDNIISATVVANKATDAGALATAFNVLKPEESKSLAASIPGTEYMLITRSGTEIKSNGWHALEIQQPRSVIPDTVNEQSSDKTMDPNYELKINLKLKQIMNMRVHRPYVAVWIADKDQKPVKNIALWYNKARYLDELRTWYHTFYGRYIQSDPNIVSTTSATRPAGNYLLTWDGRNNEGELVPKDNYTIMIEVAREHGTHQLMRKDIDFTKSVPSISLPGNAEVASVSLEYVQK